MNGAIIVCSIFFRSPAYTVSQLLGAWHRYVVNQDVAVEVAGRRVLLGDHTHVVKDGGRMPGVVSLREHSETQRKPSYFRGQCWGAVGLLVGTVEACFCLPLELRLHQGFQHLGVAPAPGSSSRPKLAERVAHMALAFAYGYERPAWLVLDAFFAVGSVFRLARSVYSIALKQPYLHILVRAKKNYVGYFLAPPKPPERPGRQALYGEKVYLWEGFDHRHFFHTVTCRVYGRLETIPVMSLPLLWAPLGDWVLVIWAITSRGPMVLMSSDLHLAPATAVELYCGRARIEIMFDVLKNLLGAFCFHFWTKKLPRHSRRPKPNRNLKAPAPHHLGAVQACWDAYERFVLCAVIAQGLLQLIALQFGALVWQHQTLYLRTQSRALPSEKTVRQVLAALILKQFSNLPVNSIIQQIRCQLATSEEDDDHEHRKAS